MPTRRPASEDVYLDIETSWEGGITVIGCHYASRGVVQLVGRDITARRLNGALPRSGRIFTFNGNGFDLPIIHRKVGVDLKRTFESWDLMVICRRAGLRGGQKKIEIATGFERATRGLDGRDAMRLWRAYCEEVDEEALRTLLAYNADDLLGMVHIARVLADYNLLDKSARAKAPLASAKRQKLLFGAKDASTAAQ